MTIRKILLFPDAHLAKRCPVVTAFDARLKALMTDLLDTLYAGPGVGLAAPQIGRFERVAVIDVARSSAKEKSSVPRGHGRLILVNPVLVKGEGEQIPREGCLSVPDWLATVRRYQNVLVEAQDESGMPRKISAAGFEALALQHEIDHLNGILFLDRVENIRTDVFRRKRYGR